MGKKLVIKYDLESGDVERSFEQVEKEASKAGKKSGRQFRKKFNKATEGLGEKVLGGLKSKLLALSAIATGIGSALVFKESIEAAIFQEDAINRLNGTLKSAGEFSETASKDFQKFAAELQQVTKFGDEVILNQLALAKSFGATNEQAKALSKAAIDLAAAQGKSLDEATRQIAKTLGGYGGELAETLPGLKQFTQEQLRAGAAIELIAKQFEGQGANAVKTFGGQLAQARNSFGDLLEEIGNFIIKNPFVIKALKELNIFFKQAIIRVREFIKEIDTFNDIIQPLLNFNSAVIDYVIAPLLSAGRVIKALFQGILTSVSLAVAGIAKIGKFLALKVEDSAKRLGLGQNKAIESLKAFSNEADKVFIQTANKTKGTLESILDTGLRDKLQEKNEELRQGFSEFNEELKAQQEQARLNAEAFDEVAAQQARKAADLARKQAEAVKKAAKEAAEAAKKLAADANRIINQGLARIVSGGIQTIVTAISAGENAFANLSKFVLGAFGDLAIQLGEFFIAEGIAVEALKAVKGAATIAAGVGLVALGTMLKNFSAKGGGGGAGSLSGAGANATNAGESGFDQSDLTDEPGAIERQEPETSISINVQGDILDSEETGTRLAKVLSDSFGKQGVVLRDARFA